MVERVLAAGQGMAAAGTAAPSPRRVTSPHEAGSGQGWGVPLRSGGAVVCGWAKGSVM